MSTVLDQRAPLTTAGARFLSEFDARAGAVDGPAWLRQRRQRGIAAIVFGASSAGNIRQSKALIDEFSREYVPA